MEALPIDLVDTLADTLTELRTGLVHGQQDPGDFQLRIKPGLYGMYHVQHVRDTLAGQEMSLDRDNTIVRRR